jgi:diacylglycerol kinase (ATP)
VRAAAIFGLGSSEKDLEPFERDQAIVWHIGLPANSSDADAILIFGGDGTVHRHLPQLVRLQLPVLVVPQGSGNDFARALKIRSTRNSRSAWNAFASGRGNIRTIDLGLITPLDSGNTPPRYFCCVGGVGLDTEIARRANRLPRWLRGHGGYAMSVPAALLYFEAWRMRIQMMKADGWLLRSDQPTVLAAFANTPAYGGGMKIAPRAVMDDGQLDVCLVADMNSLKLFCLFPTIYFGRHLEVPRVEYFQANKIRVEADAPLDVYADGEYVCRTPIEVSVESKVLRVITA